MDEKVMMGMDMGRSLRASDAADLVEARELVACLKRQLRIAEEDLENAKRQIIHALGVGQDGKDARVADCFWEMMDTAPVRESKKLYEAARNGLWATREALKKFNGSASS